MDKKFISILIANCIIFMINFLVLFHVSSMVSKIASLVISLILSGLITKCILQKYKELDLKETIFITNLTHSMRNHLAKISGNAQVLNLTNETQQSNNILFEVNELDDMITALLNYSIALENIELKSEYMISEIVESECAKFKSISDTIKFDYNIDKNIVLLTNEQNIKVLFSTLLENAFKYSKSKVECIVTSNNIYVSNDTELEDGNYDHLFERFKRENSNKVGFGVGLSLCKTIVEHSNKNLTAYVRDGIMYMNIK